MPDRAYRDDPTPRARAGTDPTSDNRGRSGETARPDESIRASLTGLTGRAGRAGPDDTGETDAERRRRRARFLRDLAEARELRDRVQPRRVKVARLRHAMRMRTFRW